ncbi:MAG: branched-chain amino acid ABC transporter permease [Chloroflexi bacterium]|nr:branched-chain amino acid ABC transporter permease [Chloroflexota bacterium]
MIRRLRWWLIAIAVMCVLPLFVPLGFPVSVIRLLVMGSYLAIFAMSWDMMSGHTGYISFGHPFLIGLAGYVTAFLSHQEGFQPPHIVLPLAVTLPLGVAAAVGGGMLFFFPSMRVRGPYFALVSLAFMEILHRLIIAVRPEFTGGDRGLPNLPSVVMGAIPNYYLSLGLMFATAIGLWYVSRSNVGNVLKAIRMDEDVVEASGISTYRFKRFAFLLSAVTAGLGGVFYTHYLASINPRRAFSAILLLDIIISAVIGGMGTIVGPMFGGYFLTFILEYLRPYLFGQWRLLAYALVAIFMVIYKPKGFYGIAQDVASWFQTRKRRSAQYGY